MALDGITLSAIQNDLIKHLPIRINKISQTSKTDIIFSVVCHGSKRYSLIISTNSNYCHIRLSNKNYPTYNDASSFTMLLRKHILNGIIYEISQYDYDRYLLIKIKSRNEIYDETNYTLSIELMGKYANIILVDDKGIIVDALKKIPPYENNNRTILPNVKFTLPDKQNKKNPFNEKEANLNESFVKQFQGFSKLLETEVRHRLNKDNFISIMSLIKNSNKIYIHTNKDTSEYHIIPLTHISNNYKEYSIIEGLDKVYYSISEKDRIKTISNDLFKIVKSQIKHFETKLYKLKISLDNTNNLLEDKSYADILYMQDNLNQKGLEKIEACDFNNEKIIIKLDPKYSIKENANKYYSKYQKKKNGKVFIEEQISIANNELEYFNSIIDQLKIADYIDALDIKEELNKLGYLKNKTNNKKKGITLYQIKVDNYTITFGKNNIQNNHVTFDYAKNNYTWFHAKQYHGAHVVVNSNELNEKIIRICANIAAYYSKGRYSSSVPVDYCLVKDIKKIKGAKPGFVSFKNYKTIYIDPFEDENLLISTI